jgi:hypothetical protein
MGIARKPLPSLERSGHAIERVWITAQRVPASEEVVPGVSPRRVARVIGLRRKAGRRRYRTGQSCYCAGCEEITRKAFGHALLNVRCETSIPRRIPARSTRSMVYRFWTLQLSWPYHRVQAASIVPGERLTSSALASACGPRWHPRWCSSTGGSASWRGRAAGRAFQVLRAPTRSSVG